MYTLYCLLWRFSICPIKFISPFDSNILGSSSTTTNNTEESVYVNITPKPKMEVDVSVYDVPGSSSKVIIVVVISLFEEGAVKSLKYLIIS